ncbi:MAG: glycosyltransferase family 4 protein [Bacteroidales bacterium]
MRILMVLESDFPPDIRVENEAAALVRNGHEVHVASYSHQKRFDLRKDLPYTLHKIHIPPLIHKASVGALKSGMYFRFWRKYLNRILRSHSFDAIHVHDLPLARVGFELSRQEKIRFTLDLHENWPALLDIATHTQTLLGRILSSGKQWRRYEKRYAGLADDVIVVVEEARDRLVALGIDADRIHVISNTVDPEHFDFPPQEKDPEHVTMIYGGGINRHRGLQTVIEALPKITVGIPDIRLLIIGPGSYTEALKKLTAELKMEPYVTFRDRLPLDALLREVSRADIALIPHLKTAHTDSTIPHKLFQYMYAGIPIISSNCAPLKRIIEETGTGVCFRSGDPDSFAESLKKLLTDKQFLQKIPENGKQWVVQKYNWASDARVLCGIYG